jgi:hypothetical protein
MNNRFVLRQSDLIAKRLSEEAEKDVPAQLTLAHKLALGRPADPEELALAKAFVADHGLAAYCRVLFNTNAFLYVR